MIKITIFTQDLNAHIYIQNRNKRMNKKQKIDQNTQIYKQPCNLPSFNCWTATG